MPLPLELKFLINAQGVYWNKYGTARCIQQDSELWGNIVAQMC